MATVKDLYDLIKKDQLEGKEIGVLEQSILDAVETKQFKTTKEVNITFIKNREGGDNGNS